MTDGLPSAADLDAVAEEERIRSLYLIPPTVLIDAPIEMLLIDEELEVTE